MTRPHVMTKVRTAPVITPTTAPPSTGLVPASGLRPGGLRASGLRPGGLKASGLRTGALGASGLTPRGRHKRPDLSSRTARSRRIVLLPAPIETPRDHPTQRPSRYVLEYSEICDLMQWSYGGGHYPVGAFEDFTELGLMAIEHELDYNGDLRCDQLGDGWCLGEVDTDTHSHPMCAQLVGPTGNPLVWSYVYDYRTDVVGLDDLWPAVATAFVKGRDWALANVDAVLELPAVGGTVAAHSLQLAGFGIQDGLHSAEMLAEVLKMHMQTDRELRSAYADWVVLNLSGALEDEPAMREIGGVLDEFEESEYPIIDPDELQWLSFSPDQFALAEEKGRLLGLWHATDAHYYSVFDEPDGPKNFPLAIGWREIEMTRTAETPGGSIAV